MAQEDKDFKKQWKAVTVAYSWLSGWGIDAKPKKGEDYDLLINDKIKVSIVNRDIGEKKEEKELSDSMNPTIYLDADKLNSRNAEEAVMELHPIFEKLKKRTMSPPRKDNVRRAKSRDYEAISMRLTPFTRAANPSNETIQKFSHIVRREADCASRRYRHVCTRTSMNSDDLYSIGIIYLCVFLHRYQDILKPQNSGALLTKYLRQEYSRWGKVTTKYMDSFCSSPSGYRIEDSLGTPCNGMKISNQNKRKEPSYELATITKWGFLNNEDDILTLELRERFDKMPDSDKSVACARIVNDFSQPAPVRRLAKKIQKELKIV